RTVLFCSLDARVMVMTMPDLETLYLKRSRATTVHYVYVFHSLVSSHAIYPKSAFWHYDSILCAGPHHVAELRKTEEVYGLPPRRLVETGYGRLDALLQGPRPGLPTEGPLRVLVAPTWGPHGLLETRGEEITEVLLEAGFLTTVRPHPMTGRRHPKVIRGLCQRFQGHPRFRFEDDVALSDSLLQSHIMVTDWSGAALEFAFAFERPVLFVDVPRKVRNPEYERLGLEPVEVSLRTRLGAILSLDRLPEIGRSLQDLWLNRDAIRVSIREAARETVYNPGTSGAAGARYIESLLGGAA
ncbi:MAG: CDP-glycerol glycerophosphotransferase family protein, partial [Candidatus Eremiobacterota bacterium]